MGCPFCFDGEIEFLSPQIQTIIHLKSKKMKGFKFLFAMLLGVVTMMSCAPAVHAQSTCELVGLPDEFAPLENCVMTSHTYNSLEIAATYTFKRVNRKMVVDTAWSYQVVTATSTSTTGFGLNWVYNYLNEFGYKHTEGMSMYKDDFFGTIPIGPHAGKTYYYGYASASFTEVPGGWDFTVKAYPFSNVEKKGGSPAAVPWQTYTMKYVNALNKTKTVTNTGTIDAKKPWLESKLGITEAWLYDSLFVTYHFRTVNPATHVCSIFGRVEKTGNTYTNATLINGRHYKTIAYQTLKMPWKDSTGKDANLGELGFSWVLYNDCAVPAVKPTDGNSTGNSGECFRRLYASTQAESLSITVIPGTAYNYSGHTLTYDSTKKAALQLVVHRYPMPEKNTEQEGYWNLKTDERIWTLQGV